MHGQTNAYLFELDELHYYPFIISLDRCDGSCNTVEDPLGRICTQ